MEWSAYPCETQTRSVKVNGKALEQRTALAVSTWPVPLFPLGFSAFNPITGADSLSYWGSFMGRQTVP